MAISIFLTGINYSGNIGDHEKCYCTTRTKDAESINTLNKYIGIMNPRLSLQEISINKSVNFNLTNMIPETTGYGDYYPINQRDR